MKNTIISCDCSFYVGLVRSPYSGYPNLFIQMLGKFCSNTSRLREVLLFRTQSTNFNNSELEQGSVLYLIHIRNADLRPCTHGKKHCKLDCRATENRFFAGLDQFLVCKTDSVCIKRIFFGPKKHTLRIIYWPTYLD